MAQDSKKIVTEVKAYARGVHISPRKVRLVADLIRDMRVEDALAQLQFLTKKAALPVRKLLDSAVANASHNFQITSDRLFIKSISVDGGRVMKSFTPRAQGRAVALRKRLSHVNLTLGVSKDLGNPKNPQPAAVKKEEAKPVAIPDVLDDKEGPPPQAEEKKRSLFAFWRKKGKETPKVDTKGKHYTGFDRRGNM